MNDLLKRIVSVTELRRKFGEITTNLAEIESLILTRSGAPFAILKSVPEEKMKILRKAAGAWKGTPFDNDKLWKEVSKRKSRRAAISLL